MIFDQKMFNLIYEINNIGLRMETSSKRYLRTRTESGRYQRGAQALDRKILTFSFSLHPHLYLFCEIEGNSKDKYRLLYNGKDDGFFHDCPDYLQRQVICKHLIKILLSLPKCVAQEIYSSFQNDTCNHSYIPHPDEIKYPKDFSFPESVIQTIEKILPCMIYHIDASFQEFFFDFIRSSPAEDEIRRFLSIQQEYSRQNVPNIEWFFLDWLRINLHMLLERAPHRFFQMLLRNKTAAPIFLLAFLSVKSNNLPPIVFRLKRDNSMPGWLRDFIGLCHSSVLLKNSIRLENGLQILL